MTKADMVDMISEKLGYTKNDAFDLVEMTLETLKQAIVKGGKVKIAGFGNFIVKEKAERRGRNPQTGEVISISQRRVLIFKASQVLKQKINHG
jgi:integration host factor subunit alpha